jgi:hypothetical protein
VQGLVDDPIIKRRLVRFLRPPDYNQLFSGDPTRVTESLGEMGDDGRPLVTETSCRGPRLATCSVERACSARHLLTQPFMRSRGRGSSGGFSAARAASRAQAASRA